MKHSEVAHLTQFDSKSIATQNETSNQKIERMVKQHSTALRCKCAKSGIFGANADDLIQEVFLRVIKTERGYLVGGRAKPFDPTRSPGSNERAWLFSIAKNIISDFFRQVGRYRARRVLPLEQMKNKADCKTSVPLEFCDPRPTAEQQFVLKEEKNQLHYFIDQLGSPHRKVLQLVLANDPTLKELGAKFGVSTPTAFRRRREAYAELRRLYMKSTSCELPRSCGCAT